MSNRAVKAFAKTQLMQVETSCCNYPQTKTRTTMTNRREFIVKFSAVSAIALGGNAFAKAAMLAEADAQAVALGYKADTTKVDKKKFPKHDVAQKCTNCALYQGKPTDAAAACPLFAGKQVAGPGWCSAWAKKA